jgi:protein-S-isoprenylcysteine O-methyltransferase Ste14
MTALRVGITVAWVVFWIYWLLSATTAKHGTRTNRTRLPAVLVIAVVAILRAGVKDKLNMNSVPLAVVGTALFVAGLALAIWARIYLGRNWGMPMSQKDDPELVTSGPYHYVRHPIYSGLLLGMIGTALATTLYWWLILAVLGAYFIYSASVEEKNLAAAFPDSYPSYRAATKMLIPFVY